MTSQKQFEANRANAQLSTGPSTAEGKHRSSLNARRHGLTGQISSMSDEDRAAHDEFSSHFIEDLAPAGAVELDLAQRIATDSWRLNRIAAIEESLFTLGQLEHAGEFSTDDPDFDAALISAHVFTEQSKQLQLLSLYEQRLNRAVQKNLALLKQLQGTRKADEAKRMESKEVAHRPTRNGFVFSTTETSAVESPAATNFPNQNPQKQRALAA